jgi:hypothetical protein
MVGNVAERSKITSCLSIQDLAPGAPTGVPGAPRSCDGFERALWIASFGQLEDVVAMDIAIQDSPNGSDDWQNITGAVFPTFTDANTEEVRYGGSIIDPARPWQRPNVVISGGVPTKAEISVCVLTHESRGQSFPTSGAGVADFNV